MLFLQSEPPSGRQWLGQLSVLLCAGHGSQSSDKIKQQGMGAQETGSIRFLSMAVQWWWRWGTQQIAWQRPQWQWIRKKNIFQHQNPETCKNYIFSFFALAVVMVKSTRTGCSRVCLVLPCWFCVCLSWSTQGLVQRCSNIPEISSQ